LNKRFSTTVRKAVILAFLASASGVQASADRMETLGKGMICMCSCNQLLSDCNMINCPTAAPMRKELQGHIDSGESDKTILEAFAGKYGLKVLSTPRTNNWFDLSAWVMPFVALLGGGVVIVFILKRRKSMAPAEGPLPIDASRYAGEIEEELKKLNPED
jgi:cytochrome c-type biogenesis protein CcmH/NrfF